MNGLAFCFPVGLDIQTDYEPVYTEGWFSKINNVTDKKVKIWF